MALAVTVAATIITVGPAAEPAAEPACPDAGLLGAGLISNICWDCIFPIQIAGQPFTRADQGGAPSAAASTSGLCLCNDPLGVPNPGITLGLWEPAKLVELVRTPGCSPLLGGTRIDSVERIHRGTRGGYAQDNGDKAFFHYHMWAFPLLSVLELFSDDSCVDDGFVDIDVLYFSELDPTWNHDELAIFLNPETAAVANPIAQAACIADAVAATVGEPIDTLFWCAGGQSLYPLTGNHLVKTSQPRTTNLLAIRAIAALHRRGLMMRTMGDDALCKGVIEPFLPKSMYNLSVAYPEPEANNRHAIGEPSLRWGEHRMIPGIGEDFLYLIWRWNDCCLVF